MLRCGVQTPAECIADHRIGNILNLTRSQENNGQWWGRCPAHDDDHKSLSVAASPKYGLVWYCHRKPEGCSGIAVRNAMLRAHISERCIPWSGVSPEDKLREAVEELIVKRLAIDELRLRLGELLWNVDTKFVAEELGIQKTAYYKYRTPR